MDFERVIRERISVRKFKNLQVSKEQLDKILEAGRIAPTAKNIQPHRIFVVQSEEGLKKIDSVSPCRYNAPTVLIICANTKEAFVKGTHSTYEMDASIVATHIMLEATNVGVDNIWIKYFDEEKLKTVFELDEGIEPVCLIPLGYRTEDYSGSPYHLKRKSIEEIVKYI